VAGVAAIASVGASVGEVASEGISVSGSMFI
jgi:hypothetical protein